MSSDSASGRSKGSRLVSANAAVMKMKQATPSESAFQTCSEAWLFTTAFSVTFPVSSSTGISESPIEISYETIWALERRPPNNAYLLFDDHPASTIPYTPSDVIARTKRNPIGRSANTMSMRPHFEAHGAPNGITAHARSAGTNERMGARKKIPLFAYGGIVSSFMRFLTASAHGWARPCGPTRLGPRRSWIHAEIRRSAKVM